MPAGRQSLVSVQEWIDRVNPGFGFEVAQRYTDAMAWSDAEVDGLPPVGLSLIGTRGADGLPLGFARRLQSNCCR